MTLATWLTFATALTIALAVPGPDLALVLTSASRSTRQGLSTAAGIVTGLCLHAAIAITGLAAVILSAPSTLAWLQLIGAGVLCWLGLAMLRATRSRTAPPRAPDAGPPRLSRTPPRSPEQQPRSLIRGYLTGLLTNAANPKALLFFAAVLPQFLTPGQDLHRRTALLAATVVATASLWWATAVALVRLTGMGRSVRSERVVAWACGLTLLALAGVLAVLALAGLHHDDAAVAPLADVGSR